MSLALTVLLCILSGKIFFIGDCPTLVCVNLSGGKPQQLKAIFDKLSQEGDVTDPLKVEIFGTYGALNDKFGVRWMFHTDQKD